MRTKREDYYRKIVYFKFRLESGDPDTLHGDIGHNSYDLGSLDS